jgi:hypothetical protein
MNHPVVIGASVGVFCGVVIALICFRLAGRWSWGGMIGVTMIIGVMTGVLAIWGGWSAGLFGVVASYMLGFVTIREAMEERKTRK